MNAHTDLINNIEAAAADPWIVAHLGRLSYQGPLSEAPWWASADTIKSTGQLIAKSPVCTVESFCVVPAERYGNRLVPKMYGQINELRKAIRAEGTPAIQEAWDRVEEHIDFAYEMAGYAQRRIQEENQ